MKRLKRVFTIISAVLLAACDHGLEPPAVPPQGSLEVSVTYTGDWPPADSLRDLRFVAFRFIPRDTTDFFRLNEMLFSPSLPTGVASQEIVIDSIEVGFFLYSGIAQRFSSDLLDWRPVGLYEENGGVFSIQQALTTSISVHVDFDHLPPFPPS